MRSAYIEYWKYFQCWLFDFATENLKVKKKNVPLNQETKHTQTHRDIHTDIPHIHILKYTHRQHIPHAQTHHIHTYTYIYHTNTHMYKHTCNTHTYRLTHRHTTYIHIHISHTHSPLYTHTKHQPKSNRWCLALLSIHCKKISMHSTWDNEHRIAHHYYSQQMPVKFTYVTGRWAQLTCLSSRRHI